jgi:cytochrome c peroxidase
MTTPHPAAQAENNVRPFAARKTHRARLAGGLGALAALLALAPLLTGFGGGEGRADPWSREEKAVLASMTLAQLPPPPADPSNAYADHPGAAALGGQFFVDARFSRNGEVACATCHAPYRQYQDDRPLGQGLATGTRRTMPVAGAAHSPWLFWDGRKDSLWSQALGPLEDAAEHGTNRARVARLVRSHYRQPYEQVFGPLPALQSVPVDASPLGSAEERQAWSRMTAAQRDEVNRVFANLGKALAAFERTVTYGESRFDRYVHAVLAGDRAGQQALLPQEVNGLRLFIGKAQCATCHNGPLLTDQHFHNTGVPPRDRSRPDRGRAPATARVQADEFNCLGRYSDAPPTACEELRFMATDDPGLEGAFKTPGLRNVALRPPYMHAGQFGTLEEVVAHYVRSPAAVVGHSELAHAGQGHAERQPIRLSPREAADLAAFLRSLSGLVVERKLPAP